MNNNTNTKYIDSLNGLRGICAVIIAFFWHYNHFTSTPPLKKLFFPFYALGEGVVEMFFLISGFVMVYAYQEKILSGYSFLTYIKRRLLHFYPLFFCTMIITSIEQILWHNNFNQYYIYGPLDIKRIVFALLLQLPGLFFSDVPINGPAWCLSIEFYLYIFLYLIIYFFRKKPAFNINLLSLIYLSLSVSSILLFIPYYTDKPFINHYTSRGNICFFLGCFLSVLYINYSSHSISKSLNKTINVIILLIIILILIILVHNNLLTKEHRIISRLIEMFIVFPLFLWLSITCKPIFALLSIKPFDFLGKISLYIYLWHFPIELLFKLFETTCHIPFNYSSIYVWMLFSGTTICISSLSWKVEKSILKRIIL